MKKHIKKLLLAVVVIFIIGYYPIFGDNDNSTKENNTEINSDTQSNKPVKKPAYIDGEYIDSSSSNSTKKAKNNTNSKKNSNVANSSSADKEEQTESTRSNMNKNQTRGPADLAVFNGVNLAGMSDKTSIEVYDSFNYAKTLELNAKFSSSATDTVELSRLNLQKVLRLIVVSV